jgi:hypothetical protein
MVFVFCVIVFYNSVKMAAVIKQGKQKNLIGTLTTINAFFQMMK